MSMKDVFKLIREKEAEFVDFRFTDTKGTLRGTSRPVKEIDTSILQNGIIFDGSAIAGREDFNAADMILTPDPSTAVMDPFTSHNTLVVICNVQSADGKPYALDPRFTAKKAEEYLKKSGVGDGCSFGTEAEFFVFDDIKWATKQEHTFFSLDSQEGAYNTDSKFENGNMGHRPKDNGGYLTVPPVDSSNVMRAEMVKNMQDMGIKVQTHNHAVAPSQHKLGIKSASLVVSADDLQNLKYCTRMVAHSFGKTATFMPKPVYNDNGSGIYIHQSILKNRKPIFAGKGNNGLSDECMYYIGGVIKHAKAINAFSNASTNSYKRLVPGSGTPALLAYSYGNRSAAFRVHNNPDAPGFQVRFGDASGNPYFTLASILMAGIDGIKNKIDPGKAMDEDSSALSEEVLDSDHRVCGSLREALYSLDKDRDFLKAGNVFTDKLIDSYISLKMEEVQQLERTPHPVEFEMYYSV